MSNREKIFNEFIEESELKPRTRDSYKVSYNYYNELDKNILQSTQTEIINYVDEIEGKSNNTKAMILNIAIQIRKANKRGVDKIFIAKGKYMDGFKLEKEKDNKEKIESLPSVTQLIAHENKLYRNKEWKGYIIVSLLRLLSARNMDLNIGIISPTRSKRKMKEDDKNNYLILRKNDVSVIRGSYKTLEKYGVKKDNIRSRKLQNAIKKYVAEKDMEITNDPIWLLSETGKKLKDDSIAKAIRKYTYKGLGEGDYNKIFVSQFVDVKNMKGLKKISDMRGTSLQVLLDSYHLEMPQDI